MHQVQHALVEPVAHFKAVAGAGHDVCWAQDVVAGLPVKPSHLLLKFEAAADAALASISGPISTE